MRRGPRIALAIAVAVATACAPRGLRAQQRGTDVGGQPARRQVTKYPKLTTFVEAEYPAAKKAAGIEASVVLTIEIAATGAVSDVAVASGATPDFDAAAVAAARRFVFSPAEVDGKPAPAKITYRYAFVIKNAPVPAPIPVPVPVPVPAPPPAAPAPETIEIVGRPRARREQNQITVRAEQARKVAGTQGDVLKVVQNLPGVSRPPVASGQLVVWGAAPRDTRIYVDGVDVPALYHGSGLRSVMSSDLVSGIDLVPGAYGAEYGRGLGGLVRVETRALPRGTHGSVGADTLDGSALVSTELSSRARIAVAARQSWLDRVLGATSARDVSDVFPIPRYRDGQLKATLDLRRREAVDAVLLGATDDLTRTVASPDPASTRSEDNHTGFWRAYLRYTNVSDNGDAVIVTPFFGHDASELVQRFGATPARLDIGSTRYGVRASLRSRLGKAVSFTTGIDALGTDSKLAREGSLTLPPREGDIAVFGQPPGDEYATDSWRTSIVDVAPHAHADVKLGPVTVTPGLRVDAFLIEGSRKTPRIGQTPGVGFSRLETSVAPRLSARWQVAPRLALSAAYGTYHQAPEPEDLSPVFGTPDLALSRATHVTVGESLRITDTLSADVVAFQKTMKDLVVRSRLSNPLLARALTQNGEGRSYGVQFMVRQALWSGFFGWVSYAISRSERRFEGDESWRAFDFDQPHVLSVVASQEIGRWSVGARFRYASGNPRTPVVGSTYDARSDRYDPVFGDHNATRVPAFWQLDVRVDRSFELGKGVKMLLFADVQNVTNRANAEEIVYSASFRQRSTIRGLPAIAVLGARLEL
jgi:TonB family protein